MAVSAGLLLLPMFVNLDGFYFQFMFRITLEPSPSFMRSRGSVWPASACWCGNWRPGIHVTHTIPFKHHFSPVVA